jgi:excisionase family DNA binding protein
MVFKNENTTYLSVTELAKALGISRVAVFKRIQKGKIPAQKLGRAYIISTADVDHLLSNGEIKEALSEERKEEIQKAVKKIINEYGDTLRLLGKE